MFLKTYDELLNPTNFMQYIIGVLLSFSTIKPQLSWFLILFSLVYALSNKLWRPIIGFIINLLLLFCLSWLLIPTWMADWFGGLTSYAEYTHTGQPIYSLLSTVFPHMSSPTQWALTGLFLITLLVSLGLANRNQIQWSGVFLYGSALTYLLHPNGMAYEQIIFLLPFTAWICKQYRRHKKSTILLWFFALFLSWLCFALGSWVYHPFDTLPVLFFVIWSVWVSFSYHKIDFIHQQGTISDGY